MDVHVKPCIPHLQETFGSPVEAPEEQIEDPPCATDALQVVLESIGEIENILEEGEHCTAAMNEVDAAHQVMGCDFPPM